MTFAATLTRSWDGQSPAPATDCYKSLPAMNPTHSTTRNSDTTEHEFIDGDVLRLQDLLGQIGQELAEPLTNALERVTTLATTGRIDRRGLKALREEVERARQAGIWAQQIARLASGRVRQSHERVHLTHTLQSVLAYRAREMQAKGIQLAQSLEPVELQVDASMLYGLLNAMVEWWLQCAQGPVELRVDLANWPADGRLHCHFCHKLADGLDGDGVPVQTQPSIDNMAWRLLEQTALTMNARITRQADDCNVNLLIEFPRTVNALLAENLMPELDHGFSNSVNSKPLAGSHVLVVVARRDMRILVRESIKSMGLVVDYVNSIPEAMEFCREGLPHCIVFESALRDNRFDELVDNIRREVPEFVFVELMADGDRFDISGVSHNGMACVGRHAISKSLPSALVYELTRIM